MDYSQKISKRALKFLPMCKEFGSPKFGLSLPNKKSILPIKNQHKLGLPSANKLLTDAVLKGDFEECKKQLKLKDGNFLDQNSNIEKLKLIFFFVKIWSDNKT